MILEEGWSPSNNTPMMSSSMDPFIEQMSNLKAFITQAKADGKYDIAATLESNLKDLQSHYYASKESNDTE